MSDETPVTPEPSEGRDPVTGQPEGTEPVVTPAETPAEAASEAPAEEAPAAEEQPAE